MLTRGIATVGYGQPYYGGAQRLRGSLSRVFSIFRLPDEEEIRIVDGWDYTGYCLKPLALAHIAKQCNLALLLDASVVALKPLDPLWAHIEKHGYYLGESGFSCGQWTSDEMLEAFKITRDEVIAVPQPASGIVGLDLRRATGKNVVEAWVRSRHLFPGHHSNINAENRAYSYRNEGFVSKDPRCLGHRHDQAALGLIAHQLGLTDFQPWTRPGLDAGFAAYGRENVTERSVLVVEGL